MKVDFIINAVIATAAFLTAGGVIVKAVKSCIKKLLEPSQKQLHNIDVRECRTMLIDFMADYENGIKKNEVQWKIAHDTYDHYTETLNENSYVHDYWERLFGKKN